jgi:hypothetical protein
MITNNYNLTVVVVIALVSIILKLFLRENYSEDGSSGPATTALWSYGLMGIAVLGYIFISFALTTQMSNITKYNTLKFVGELLKNSIPAILLLSIIIWLITINVIHFSQINKGHIANEYTTYSTLSTILLITQIFVVFKFITDANSKYAIVNYLLALGNVIVVGIMTIILTYFSTDG